MSVVIVENMPIVEGFITIYDNGSYTLIEQTPSGPRETRYERGRGPYALQLLVERALASHAGDRDAARARGLDERLSSIREANEELRRRLREAERGTRSGDGVTLPRTSPRAPVIEPRDPPAQDGPAIPVSAPLTVRLGPAPPTTFNCTFSPLYEIFGNSLRVRARAISPPPGADWRLSLYECPARWPRVHGTPDYCDRAFDGEVSDSGRTSAVLEFHYDPALWVTRRVFFRIRNGSTEPIPDVELTLTPVVSNPALQLIHDVLMFLGLLPGIGAVADGTDLVLYVLEGDAGGATLSAAAMLPVFGDLVTLARVGSRSAVRVPQRVVAGMEREALQNALREAMERDARAGARARVDAPDSRARAPRADVPEGATRREAREAAARGGPEAPRGEGGASGRAADEAAGDAADEAVEEGADAAASGGRAASGARGMARYTEEGRALLDRAVEARGTTSRRMVASFSRVGDDIVRFVNRFHAVTGAELVIRDYLVGGRMRQGSVFVMRYCEANIARTSTNVREMVFEQVRSRRRTDLVAFDVRYEFKSVMEFRAYDERLRRQLRLDVADLLADMPMTPQALRWVFDGGRLGGGRFERTFLVREIQDVLSREFGSHPRMSEMHAWIETIVEIWSR